MICHLATGACGAVEAVVPLADFMVRTERQPGQEGPFALEGVVRSLSEDRRLVALQDASGIRLVECPGIPAEAVVGSGLRIEGRRAVIGMAPSRIRILPADLIVTVDGIHSMQTRSGSVRLEKGARPFSLDWFNASGDGKLVLEYEGPGISRRVIPSSAFQHTTEAGSQVPGLSYRAYLHEGLASVSDLSDLLPEKEGATADLDLKMRPRANWVGLSFQGTVRLPETGVYTFHLGSDDGSRLQIGDGGVSCTVVPSTTPSAPPELWSATMPAEKSAWVKASGVVTFAAWNKDRLEIDIVNESSFCHVTVLSSHAMPTSPLLLRRVDVEGIGGRQGITVLSPGGLRLGEAAQATPGLMTQVIQVRQLPLEESRKAYPVRIRGVVTTTLDSQRSLTIQDASGGIFVRTNVLPNGRRPRVGELWEIQGKTSAGLFAPVIEQSTGAFLGLAPPPTAIRPSWDQIVTGNVDSELVEIEGVIAIATASRIGLLTREGLIQINDDDFYPLPTRDMDGMAMQRLPGSVVRMRGVFKAMWDQGGYVRAGECMLGNALMSVSDPAPVNPFAAPATPVSELLLFSSHAGAFRRVHVTGQVIHAQPPLYHLNSEGKGFRVLCRDGGSISAGDCVDVSGFLRLGAFSPEVVEARMQRNGAAALPTPAAISDWTLPDSRLDAMRVEMEATVTSDTRQDRGRSLELEDGTLHFMARMSPSAESQTSLRPGSRVRITGTYVAFASSGPSAPAEEFEILLNGPSDLVILRQGPWWTLRHTITTVALLSAGMCAAGVWVLLLRRTVAQRTKQLAQEIGERQAAEHQRGLERERARVASDLHDELGASLTEVGMLATTLKLPSVTEETRADFLDRLTAVSHNMVSSLDEIVWALNPRYDSIGGLADYLSLFARRFLELADIRCRISIEGGMTDYTLSSTCRHSIFLAFKEALNNIVRHAEATEVHLSLTTGDRMLQLQINDNGRGFDAAEHAAGSDGLAGMSERLAGLGGHCDISTVPGTGTTVLFRIPLESHES